MALILCLETATKVCSVALSLNGELLKECAVNSENYSHAEKLNGLILDLFNETEYQLKDLSAVAVSEGPGSYTGLRIGTSTAKGLCYALDIPLIAVNSLKALAALKNAEEMRCICPMFDARRMEVYSAVYDSELNELEPTRAVVIEDDSFRAFLAEGSVCFLGPGAEKCQEILTHENAVFDLETTVSAAGMVALAYQNYQSKNYVDLAYFEPFYLKDFIAGMPKKLF